MISAPPSSCCQRTQTLQTTFNKEQFFSRILISPLEDSNYIQSTQLSNQISLRLNIFHFKWSKHLDEGLTVQLKLKMNKN